jgi:hypothetical protein
MTSRETLEAVRELRQQLGILGDTLDGRLIDETPEALDSFKVAREYIACAVAELNLGMERIRGQRGEQNI